MRLAKDRQTSGCTPEDSSVRRKALPAPQSRAIDVRGDDVQSRAVRRCTYLPLVYRPTFSVLQPNSEPDALRRTRAYGGSRRFAVNFPTQRCLLIVNEIVLDLG